MDENHKVSVAVVGLGACGLTTLKNLLEAGFDATGYDHNDYLGGYTDFPYDDVVADFPSAAQTVQYLNRYADHFNLKPHIRLNTKITRFSHEKGRWNLQTVPTAGQEGGPATFDKVAICVGLAVQEPKMPIKIRGIESFTGKVVHSTQFKQPESFGDKRVLVVGLGNTGPDIAVDLIGHASKIWLSHRRGNAIFSRRDVKGRPRDHALSLRLAKMAGRFNKYLPRLAQTAAVFGMKHMQKKSFHIKREWNLGIPQVPTRKVATMNDRLVPAIHSGQLGLKPGLVEIKDSTLVFPDGSELEKIDAIILCTGFRSDYSYMSSEADPTRDTRGDWATLQGADGRPLPRLYQGIFSLDFPDSLAFLGTSPLTPQACLNYDISSAAVSQIWAGRSSLPPLAEMNASVDAQHEMVCKIASTGELANTNLRDNWDWFTWCDEAAGLGLVKRMSYGLEGWKFWLHDMKLSNLVMDGIMSPHLFRLFDEGKRKPWDGARKAVEKVNTENK